MSGSIYFDNLLSPGKLMISLMPPPIIAMATIFNHFIYQADSGFQQHKTVVVSNRCVNVFSCQGSDKVHNLKAKEQDQLLHSSL